MVNLPAEIQARRVIEDNALRLGQERAQLDAQLAGNTTNIKQIIGHALDVGIPLEQLAQMVHVSRQTLHQWRTGEGAPTGAR
jgi:DNA-binding transcriptional regulator YiaG